MTAHYDHTPLQELFLEVLAARHRTGETLWTFSSRSAIISTAARLEAKGLIWVMGGCVDNTFRAGLTEQGMKEFLKPDYVTPNDRTQPAKLAGHIHRAVDAVFDDFIKED